MLNNDPAVNVVVVSQTIFPRSADKLEHKAPAVNVLTFPRIANGLLVVIEDARVVKLPIEAVNVVVASVITFSRFADRVLIAIEESRRTVKFQIGAEKLPEVNVATVS